MGWSDIVENKNSGDFTKLEPGKPVVIHILGEPEKHALHWVDEKTTPCTGGSCLNCKDGVKKTYRYRVKVFNLTTNKQESLEAGISVFGQIKETLEAMDGDISGSDFQIKKTGSGLNTEYKVVNLPTKFKPEMAADEPLPF